MISLLIATVVNFGAIATYQNEDAIVSVYEQSCAFDADMPESTQRSARATYKKGKEGAIEGCATLVAYNNATYVYIKWQDGDTGMVPTQAFKRVVRKMI